MISGPKIEGFCVRIFCWYEQKTFAPKRIGKIHPIRQFGIVFVLSLAVAIRLGLVFLSFSANSAMRTLEGTLMRQLRSHPKSMMTINAM